jgi:hypothetical protein
LVGIGLGTATFAVHGLVASTELLHHPLARLAFAANGGIVSSMQVLSTNMTIADYCEDMTHKAIVVNPDYQRSNRIWPAAARSYLLDTILHGYPVPKISLYQRTDVATRKTYKEIVDGQQRSRAIHDFYSDNLRLSGKGEYIGSIYSTLDEDLQHAFLDYRLSIDLFVGVTDQEIREVFRRTNSYNVPLNDAEKRHATYQGAFKWYALGLSERYSQLLKSLGTFTNSQLVRMADISMFTDVIYTVLNGISSASEVKLDSVYRQFDASFPIQQEMDARFTVAFDRLMAFESLRGGFMMKSYNVFTLLLALMHVEAPIPKLILEFDTRNLPSLAPDLVETNLSMLADIGENGGEGELKEFYEACSKGTNRIGQRQVRFVWACRALTQNRLT